MASGGKRVGAGRKEIPLLERKEPVTVFIKRITINKHGGDKNVREKICKYLEDN